MVEPVHGRRHQGSGPLDRALHVERLPCKQRVVGSRLGHAAASSHCGIGSIALQGERARDTVALEDAAGLLVVRPLEPPVQPVAPDAARPHRHVLPADVADASARRQLGDVRELEIEGIEVLTELFILRGVPGYIRSDNGPEFVAEAVRR